MQFVSLNNDFYNDAIGVNLVGVAPDNANSLAQIQFVSMDNIFDGSTTAAIQIFGQELGSIDEYNLYYNNAFNILSSSIASVRAEERGGTVAPFSPPL